MKEADLKKLAKIPRYLIPGRGKAGSPGMLKKHVARLCFPINEEWRLFSESCLRNRYFRNRVMRGDNCKACDRKLDDRSRIEQHHNCYLNVCRYEGALLPEESEDVHRQPRTDEWPDIPDCRQCHAQNPEHFNECLRRVHQVHAACHEKIHEKERYFRNKAKQELLDQFNNSAGAAIYSG